MSNLLDQVFAGENGIANSIIRLFGNTAIITVTDNDYDSSNGEYDQITEEYEIIASPPLGYNIRDYSDTNILRGDLYCYINADSLHKEITKVDVASLRNAKILLNEESCFEIISLNPIYSGALIACYKIQLRNTE